MIYYGHFECQHIFAIICIKEKEVRKQTNRQIHDYMIVYVIFSFLGGLLSAGFGSLFWNVIGLDDEGVTAIYTIFLTITLYVGGVYVLSIALEKCIQKYTHNIVIRRFGLCLLFIRRWVRHRLYLIKIFCKSVKQWKAAHMLPEFFTSIGITGALGSLFVVLVLFVNRILYYDTFLGKFMSFNIMYIVSWFELGTIVTICVLGLFRLFCMVNKKCGMGYTDQVEVELGYTKKYIIFAIEKYVKNFSLFLPTEVQAMLKAVEVVLKRK